MVGVLSLLSSGEQAACSGSHTCWVCSPLWGFCSLDESHQHGLVGGDTPGILYRDFRQVWLAFPSLQGLCQTLQTPFPGEQRGAHEAPMQQAQGQAMSLWQGSSTR